MQRTPQTVTLSLVLLCLGCSGPKQTVVSAQPQAVEEAPAAESTCPAGSARVLRAEETRLVSVQEAFSGAQSGDAITLCPGRAFTDATLRMEKVEGVTITGQGTSLVARGDFPVVQLADSVGVTLEGVHVVHEVGEWCAHGCVEIYDSRQMTVRDADLDGSGYFGIVLWKVSASDFRDNRFHNCHYGFSSMNAEGITLSGNTFEDNRGANLDVRGENTFLNDVEKDNVLGPMKGSAAPKDPAH